MVPFDNKRIHHLSAMEAIWFFMASRKIEFTQFLANKNEAYFSMFVRTIKQAYVEIARPFRNARELKTKEINASENVFMRNVQEIVAEACKHLLNTTEA